MIETLVSILLMTIGLLGVGGLMMAGVNNASGFDLSSRASQAANEIMDAMRANATNAKDYITAYGTVPSSLTGTTPAAADRAQWLTNVQRLPGGDGRISYADPSAACATGGLSACDYIVSIRFANCLGTLSAAELAACTTVASDNEKRTISFRFRI
jgi:type IV pilus assembly protein PilV